jgi:hypothetical protein
MPFGGAYNVFRLVSLNQVYQQWIRTHSGITNRYITRDRWGPSKKGNGHLDNTLRYVRHTVTQTDSATELTRPDSSETG